MVFKKSGAPERQGKPPDNTPRKFLMGLDGLPRAEVKEWPPELVPLPSVPVPARIVGRHKIEGGGGIG
jgi:hypothetical protein